MASEEAEKILLDPAVPESVQLCTHCLSPVPVGQYYCQQCGETASDLTPYIPFVNIRFVCNFYKRLWRTACYDKRASILVRIFCLVLIVLFAPVMLIGVPFLLWQKIHKTKRNVPDSQQHLELETTDKNAAPAPGRGGPSH